MLLACVTGSVDDERLLCNEYLVTENRILRNQIEGRVTLTDAERQALNVMPFPNCSPANDRGGAIVCYERLGGLLKHYHRRAV